jgi:protein-S-isoprenylcysteine O-methyltransferase Ste14
MTANLNDFGVVIACWLIYLFTWLISSFFVKRSVTKMGPGWIIWRLLIVAILVLFIRYDKTGTLAFLEFLFKPLFTLIIPGTVLTVLGLLGALWARIYLGRNWSGYVTYKEDQDLVTSGPYRFIRHPIYTSLALMILGTDLCYGSLFISIVFVGAAITFILRTKKEEEIMIRLFGQKYIDYMKRTKALIPWIY